MRKSVAFLCIMLLFLITGCNGIITGGDRPAEISPVALPVFPSDVAYEVEVQFLDTPAAVADKADTGNGTSQDVGDAAFGLAAWGSKLPLIGWMFGARVAERASRNFGKGRAGAGGDTVFTSSMLRAAIESGRVKSIKCVPRKMVEPEEQK